MNILDFFRKFRKKEDETIEKEKLNLDQLENWLKLKNKEINSEEKNLLSIIEDEINNFEKRAEEKITILNKFDIESKKEKDRLKFLTEDGRKKYTESLENTINLLKNLKKENFEKTISEIDKILFNFLKKTSASYERATILIGKEVAETKETIKQFSKKISEILDSSKQLPESKKTLSLVGLKLQNLEKINKEIKKSEQELSHIDKELKEKQSETENLDREIEQLKKSKEYNQYSEKKKTLDSLKNQLEKEISELRQLIDFKALGNFFHIFPEKISLVNTLKNNFNKSFKEDNGETILSLLEQSKLGNETIYNKIKILQDKKEEIKQVQSEIKKSEISKNLSQLRNLKQRNSLEKENLQQKRTKEEKILKNYKSKKSETIHDIQKQVSELGAELRLNK